MNITAKDANLSVISTFTSTNVIVSVGGAYHYADTINSGYEYFAVVRNNVEVYKFLLKDFSRGNGARMAYSSSTNGQPYAYYFSCENANVEVNDTLLYKNRGGTRVFFIVAAI